MLTVTEEKATIFSAPTLKDAMIIDYLFETITRILADSIAYKKYTTMKSHERDNYNYADACYNSILNDENISKLKNCIIILENIGFPNLHNIDDYVNKIMRPINKV